MLNMRRSTGGCWTCRLRRKKCDEKHPACDACEALQITCNYDPNKPEWMDGGVKQEAMAERIKREVKQGAPYRRRADYNANVSGERQFNGLPSPSTPESPRTTWGTAPLSREFPRDSAPETSWSASERTFTAPAQLATITPSVSEQIAQIRPFSQSDSVHLMFYLDTVLPFLLPFYQPSPLLGGKAWILDLVISSPVVREATLCQSSYFFALARGGADHDRIWQTALAQAQDAFVVLGRGVEVLGSTGIAGYTTCAVRIMTAVMQLQRFEIAITCFTNCRAHLNAAVELFQQLLDAANTHDPTHPVMSFHAVLNLLDPSLSIWSAEGASIPRAERTAFLFSTTLLLYDDIIASAILHERPQLYNYHQGLLHVMDGRDGVPLIDFETLIGCQNWALMGIGEIAALDAWKQRCSENASLDMMQLVHRASSIKTMLETHLGRLEVRPIHSAVGRDDNLLDRVLVGRLANPPAAGAPSRPNSWATHVWAHAAFLYLSIVVSGWQPASADVRYHVAQIIELTSSHLAPGLLRTIAWPFCIAGCLAEACQASQLRNLVDGLQPPGMFGTIHRAFAIMEHVWRDRARGSVGDFASYFRSGEDFVLLV